MEYSILEWNLILEIHLRWAAGNLNEFLLHKWQSSTSKSMFIVFQNPLWIKIVDGTWGMRYGVDSLDNMDGPLAQNGQGKLGKEPEANIYNTLKWNFIYIYIFLTAFVNWIEQWFSNFWRSNLFSNNITKCVLCNTVTVPITVFGSSVDLWVFIYRLRTTGLEFMTFSIRISSP